MNVEARAAAPWALGYLAVVLTLGVTCGMATLPAAQGPPLAEPPAQTCTANGPLPDSTCTPGSFNPDVTQETIGETICVRGWTATIRPPVEVTNRIKRERLAAYGYAGRDPRDFELDHLASLEIGGAPADVGNLWTEEYVRADGWGAHTKDRLENVLKADICSGAITLAEAQQCITVDWVSCYERMISH